MTELWGQWEQKSWRCCLYYEPTCEMPQHTLETKNLSGNRWVATAIPVHVLTSHNSRNVWENTLQCMTTFAVDQDQVEYAEIGLSKIGAHCQNTSESENSQSRVRRWMVSQAKGRDMGPGWISCEVLSHYPYLLHCAYTKLLPLLWFAPQLESVSSSSWIFWMVRYQMRSEPEHEKRQLRRESPRNDSLEEREMEKAAGLLSE